MTPEAAKLIRSKFPLRAEWRRHVRASNEKPRDPGSMKPFWRIKALVQDAVDASQNLASMQNTAAKLLSPAWWKFLFSPKALELETAQAGPAVLAAHAALTKARAALEAYRSRGKGKGKSNPFYGNKPGKYSPHQSTRECARRRMQLEKF